MSTSEKRQTPFRFCPLKKGTGYMNSVLQLLYGWPAFRAYMYTHNELGIFHQLLSELFDEMDAASASKNEHNNKAQNEKTVIVDPAHFVARFRQAAPQFSVESLGVLGGQTFLTILLQLLHEEVNQASRLAPAVAATEEAKVKNGEQAWNYHVAHVDNSFFSNSLLAMLESTNSTVVNCPQCSIETSSKWSFIWHLQLTLDDQEKQSLLLSDLIANYFALQNLTNEEVKCPVCKGPKSITKMVSFKKAPPFLLVYLKPKSDRPVKINLKMQIVPDDEKDNIICYRLMGVVLHEGDSVTDGHYCSLLEVDDESFKLKNWMAVSDDKFFSADECTDSAVFESKQKYVYIALYEALYKKS